MSEISDLTNYFYKELKNIYDNSDYSSNNKQISSLDSNLNDSDNICLISQELLDDTQIKLKCGHQFNYRPLYNDLKLHKFKYNYIESYKLACNEIRCPYCKTIIRELIPYNKIIKEPPMYGINTLLNNTHVDSTKFVKKQCIALLVKGKNKGNQCCNNVNGKKDFCTRHFKKYVA